MARTSAARAQRISVRVDSGGDPWIKVKGSREGCWNHRDIEGLINDLAEAIGKTVTLEDAPEPAPEGVYLPKGIGAMIDSGVHRYVRVAENTWRNARYPDYRPFTDEEMRSCRGGKPYTILSEGVEL